MDFEYPSSAEIIEANKRVLQEIPVKRKDSHDVLSYRKIDAVLEVTRYSRNARKPRATCSTTPRA
ncbi:hypothetical protein AUJ14_01645 [Candidatus Micrarchaeota archaeon CG1_02_55_22]|nr:MAG: hypothetical protein AUJ14_01645 [Candidatus Micrarchaeota archaeon CG1_02_55_22]